MSTEDDSESKLMMQMFDEIMKMIREEQIKLESIIQSMAEQGTIPRESFDRVYKLLTEYGKKKQWIQV